MAVKTVQVTINGQTHNATLNQSTGKYEVAINAPSDSSYSKNGHYYPVNVNVTDTAGNAVSADDTHATLGDKLKLFVKEQAKPVATIISPSSGAYITNNKPTIQFKVVDNTTQSSGYSGIDKSSVVLKINGTAVTGITWENTTGGYIGSYTPTEALRDGNVTISVECKDNDGNSSDVVTASFTLDTVAPSLTLSSPSDGLETNNENIEVVGNTDDATSKPVTIKMSLNGTDQGAVTVGSDGSFRKALKLTKQGENVLNVTATDTAGKSTTITKKIIYNTTAPQIISVDITPNPVNAGQQLLIEIEVM